MSQKNVRNFTFEYLSQTSTDFNNFWCTKSWVNYALGLTIFHLTWKASLHYLVKHNCFQRMAHSVVRSLNDKKHFCLGPHWGPPPDLVMGSALTIEPPLCPPLPMMCHFQIFSICVVKKRHCLSLSCKHDVNVMSRVLLYIHRPRWRHYLPYLWSLRYDAMLWRYKSLSLREVLYN